MLFGWRFKYTQYNTMYVAPNSEANASELLDNIEEMVHEQIIAWI